MGLRFIGASVFVALALTGCGIDTVGNVEIQKKSSRILAVTTTNYQTGALAFLDLDNRISQLSFAPIYPDALVKSLIGLSDVFVINRLGADNIQRIDRDTGHTLSQFSVGLGSNPQDMILNGEDAYISRLQKAELLKVSSKTGQIIKEISLSELSDSDDSPEPARMAMNGEDLWVQLQKLDQNNSFAPVGSAQIAIIDTKKDEIKGVLDLQGTNPVTAFKMESESRWLVGDAGYVGSESRLDGGIELIDVAQKKSLGFITTEAQLGGDLVDFECVTPAECLAIISKPETELVVFDRETGEKTRSLWVSTGYHLRQILREAGEGLVYVADANPMDPKIRVWSEVNLQQELYLNWSLKLPPYQMEFLY